jgi:hypothetical protein
VNNGGTELAVNGNGSFAFPEDTEQGTTYNVQVSSQPGDPVQTCTAFNNFGTVGNRPIKDVRVICSTQTYTVGGSVTGLLGSGLKLVNNAQDEISIDSNGGFAFPLPLADGSSFNVQISNQPTSPSQTCTPTLNTGSLNGAHNSSISIVCSTNSFIVGGTVTGLAGSGLQLKNNGGDFVSISNNGTFTFSSPIADGSTFEVQVHQQPTNLSQTCTVSSNTGVINSSDIESVLVSCTTNSFTIGGSVTGLSGSGLKLLNNEAIEVSISSNGSFTFPSALMDGQSYSIEIKSQPEMPGQDCILSNENGILTGANVTDITVHCTTHQYTVGGTVAGLNGSGLKLKNNGGDEITVASNGSFQFPTAIDDGSNYSVTISSQPTSPVQSCTATNNTGTVNAGNVASISIVCTTGDTIGGRVSGLNGTLVLQNNSGDNTTITADGSFSMQTPIASGEAYNISILSKPSLQTCIIENGSGTTTGVPVTNILVYCYVTGDTSKPTVFSTTPTNAATSVNPVQGQITVQFSEPMRIGLIPALTTETYNGSSWVATPSTGSTMSWTNSKTLQIDISWIRFPEMTRIRWTLNSANIKDAAGNAIAANVQQTFTTTTSGETFPVADSGLTLCYNTSSTPQPCADSSWPGQDGDFIDTPNARSFTGPTSSATYANDFITTDNLAGITWKTCVEGLTGSDCSTGTVTTNTNWYNAVNACAYLNSLNDGAGYSGKNDWRLPTKRELQTLFWFEGTLPIEPHYFPNSNFFFHWSSTTFSLDNSSAWVIQRTTSGHASNGVKIPLQSRYVRCVSH